MWKDLLTGIVVVGTVAIIINYFPTLAIYLGAISGFLILSGAVGVLIREVRRDMKLDSIGRGK